MGKFVIAFRDEKIAVRLLEGWILGKFVTAFRVLRHEKTAARLPEHHILGKRGRGQSKVAFIKKECRDISMQTYLGLKRAAGDKHQWRGIIRMLHNYP